MGIECDGDWNGGLGKKGVDTRVPMQIIPAHAFSIRTRIPIKAQYLFKYIHSYPLYTYLCTSIYVYFYVPLRHFNYYCKYVSARWLAYTWIHSNVSIVSIGSTYILFYFIFIYTYINWCWWYFCSDRTRWQINKWKK